MKTIYRKIIYGYGKDRKEKNLTKEEFFNYLREYIAEFREINNFIDKESTDYKDFLLYSKIILDFDMWLRYKLNLEQK